jgi:hypothetical protein
MAAEAAKIPSKPNVLWPKTDIPTPGELVDRLPAEMQTSRGKIGNVPTAAPPRVSPSEAVDRLPMEMQTSGGKLPNAPEPGPAVPMGGTETPSKMPMPESGFMTPPELTTVEAMKQAIALVGPEKFRQMAEANMAKRMGEQGTYDPAGLEMAVTEATARQIVDQAKPLNAVDQAVLEQTGKSLGGPSTEVPKLQQFNKELQEQPGMVRAQRKMAVQKWKEESPNMPKGTPPPDLDQFMSHPERGAMLSPYEMWAITNTLWKALRGKTPSPWYGYKTVGAINKLMARPDVTSVDLLGKIGRAVTGPSALGFPFAQEPR